MQEQITSNVLMVRPISFAYNEETALSNKFQKKIENSDVDNNQSAQIAFDEFVEQLRLRDINVMVIQDYAEPFTPDSIFPNNWLSMHHSGKLILYPMEAPNRRAERRNDIIEKIKTEYTVEELIDLSYFEDQNKFLEGTGSLVLDRINRIAYACLSSRTNIDVLQEWERIMNYEMVLFKAEDQDGVAIYHTNVLMCMGDTFAVVCLDAISDIDERLALKQKIESTNKAVIEISFEQMNNFAGNMLLLKNKKNKKFLVMSDKAYESLNEAQKANLSDYAEIIHPELGVIETIGGGSARCMIAEIHLVAK
ncbi:amidinotransferase [Lacihabitans sp. LS3-19]|uniref:citrulline utilization hydrolase CtlX n=1 Tax=Lacihabitans sp. LS3-19 TaxID=2487335 RepID=UPI0020CC89CB|nr:arginine deiminase-related protein [Lacihabitans sp. LS3-19]MCP9769927.1 amidinotransferase [Lacihabitans sp. LS3-19]